MSSSHDVVAKSIFHLSFQEFATQNLLAERQRQQFDPGSMVWPFIHIMDDSCVMWQNLSVDNSNK